MGGRIPVGGCAVCNGTGSVVRGFGAQPFRWPGPGPLRVLVRGVQLELVVLAGCTQPPGVVLAWEPSGKWLTDRVGPTLVDRVLVLVVRLGLVVLWRPTWKQSPCAPKNKFSPA